MRHQRTTAGGMKRRGVASVLAMLYLVIFAALALGFYAATTMSSQVAQNERTTVAAQIAAESGVQFMRYQMGALNIPSDTNTSTLMSVVAAKLAERMNPTLNMSGGKTVAMTTGAGGPQIEVPLGDSNYVSLDASGANQFRAVITQNADQMVMRLKGRTGSTTVSRVIEVKFQKAPRASKIFNYGVASRGKIVTSGSSTITGATDPTKGSVLSTLAKEVDNNPIVIGGKEVSGDISTTNPDAVITYGGAKIGGTTNTALIERDHIHRGVPAPTFPTVDTTIYKQYATNVYSGTGTITSDVTLVNARIPAGTNPNFTGNVTIQGVLYVEMPNVVSFGGNASITGVIVVQNKSEITGNPLLTSAQRDAALNPANNAINFTGSVDASPIGTLPAATFPEVRKLSGAFILAPESSVKMWGSFDAGISGSIICQAFEMGGSAEGTVKGSIVVMGDARPTTISGSADVIIASTGTSDYPPGVTFGVTYVPLPGSYLEVLPQ